MKYVTFLLFIFAILGSCSRDNSPLDTSMPKEFKIKTWNKYTPENSPLIGTPITSIKIDNLNRAWIGTEAGLSMVDGDIWRNHTESSYHKWVRDILVENTDMIWFQTSRDVIKFFPSQWYANRYERVNDFTGISLVPLGMHMWDIDVNGIKWTVCTWYENSLAYFTEDPYHYSSERIPIGNDCFPGRMIITGDIIWVSSTCGLHKYDGATWTNYNVSNSALTEYTIHDLIKDAFDNLYILTAKWITRIDNNDEWKRIKIADTDMSIRRFVIDEDSNFIIGTESGFIIYYNGNWSQFDSYIDLTPKNWTV